MKLPGIRNIRVKSFTPSSIEEHYERLQPQGRGRVGACQQDCRRSRRTDRERDSRVHQVPERRGRARRAPALDQGAADRECKAHRTGRLYGAAKSFAKVKLLLGASVRRTVILIPLLTILLFLVTACSHPKQAHVDVPPP